MRKRKLQVYEQYLERRAMLHDFADMAAFLASDAWAALYSERLARCCSRSRHLTGWVRVLNSGSCMTSSTWTCDTHSLCPVT